MGVLENAFEAPNVHTIEFVRYKDINDVQFLNVLAPILVQTGKLTVVRDVQFLNVLVPILVQTGKLTDTSEVQLLNA